MGQLIEYKIRNIFLEKSWTKCGGEASPTHFYIKKKKIEHISESTDWNVIRFTFTLSASRGLPKYVKTKVLTTCFYLI